MSKQPETRFKERVQKRLREIPNSWFIKMEAGAVRGIPDIMGCVNGFFVAIELKRSSRAKVDALQTYNLDVIRKVGKGYSYLMYPGNMEVTLAKIMILAKKTSTKH